MTTTRMPRRDPLLFALSLTLAASPAHAATAQPGEWFKAEGEAMFKAVGATGLVVVMVTPAGVLVHGYGETRPGSGTTPGQDALVRIASTSKLLTADVTLKLAAEGKLGLDDPLQRYAPAGALVPLADPARPITLRHLATHTSGLPRAVPGEPKGLAPLTWPVAPLRWQWLSTQAPATAPGVAAAYSNVGFDLLADALAAAGGKPYPALLREKTTGPLHMMDTTPAPSAAQCARLMQAEAQNGECADASAGAGTGGLYSTPADMARWLAYALGANRAQRFEARAFKVIGRESLANFKGLDHGGPASGIGLGWVQLAAAGDAPMIMQKTGALAGFISYTALAPERQVGVFAVATRGDMMAGSPILVRHVQALLARAVAKE